MKKIGVRLGSNGYDIHIGSGLLSQVRTRLAEIGFRDKLVIITDPTVKNLYGSIVEQSLISGGFNVTVLEIP